MSRDPFVQHTVPHKGAHRSGTFQRAIWGVLMLGILGAVGWAAWTRIKTRLSPERAAVAGTQEAKPAAPGAPQPEAAPSTSIRVPESKAAPAPAPALPVLKESATPAEKATVRAALVEQFAKEHAPLQRYFNTVKTGTVAEAEPLVQGRTRNVPKGRPEHLDLIRWLFLDPPANPELRLMVTKVAIRSLSAEELVKLLEVCQYPGSPNEKEARECAGWLLDLNASNFTEALRQKLRELSAEPGK